MPELLKIADSQNLNCFYVLSQYIPLNFFVICVVLLFSLFTVVVIPLIKFSYLGVTGYILVLLGGGINVFFRAVYGCVNDPLLIVGLVSFNIWDVCVMVGLCMLGIVLYHSITIDISKGIKTQ